MPSPGSSRMKKLISLFEPRREGSGGEEEADRRIPNEAEQTIINAPLPVDLHVPRVTPTVPPRPPPRPKKHRIQHFPQTSEPTPPPSPDRDDHPDEVHRPRPRGSEEDNARPITPESPVRSSTTPRDSEFPLDDLVQRDQSESSKTIQRLQAMVQRAEEQVARQEQDRQTRKHEYETLRIDLRQMERRLLEAIASATPNNAAAQTEIATLRMQRDGLRAELEASKAQQDTLEDQIQQKRGELREKYDRLDEMREKLRRRKSGRSRRNSRAAGSGRYGEKQDPEMYLLVKRGKDRKDASSCCFL